MLTYQILETEKLLIIKAKGPTSFKEAFDIISDIDEDQRYKVGMNGIMDAREMEQALGDVTDFHQAAEVASNKNFTKKPAKTAIIVDDTNDTIKSLMDGFVLMTSASPVERKVFKHSQWREALNFIEFDKLPAESIVQYEDFSLSD